MEPGLQTPGQKGQNREDVRQHNLSTVLRLVRLSETISRSQLTAATGLNRSTISDLVAELEERGLAIETEALVSSGVGRPSLMVSAMRKSPSLQPVSPLARSHPSTHRQRRSPQQLMVPRRARRATAQFEIPHFAQESPR